MIVRVGQWLSSRVDNQQLNERRKEHRKKGKDLGRIVEDTAPSGVIVGSVIFENEKDSLDGDQAALNKLSRLQIRVQLRGQQTKGAEFGHVAKGRKKSKDIDDLQRER